MKSAPKSQNKKDLRKSDRIGIDEAYIEIKDHEIYEIINLSEGGVFLPSSKPFPIGTNLDIRLHIQNLKKIIDTRGRVVRHGEVNGIKGFGLQFQITDPIEKGILKKIIQRSGP